MSRRERVEEWVRKIEMYDNHGDPARAATELRALWAVVEAAVEQRNGDTWPGPALSKRLEQALDAYEGGQDG
jgi:hypothetical protein